MGKCNERDIEKEHTEPGIATALEQKGRPCFQGPFSTSTMML